MEAPARFVPRRLRRAGGVGGLALLALTLGSVSLGIPSAAGRSLAPPQNLSPPTISGVAEYQEPLTASPGTWSNAPTAFAYQWQRCYRYSDLVRQDSPLSYWRLGESVGTVATDQVEANTGSYMNNPGLAAAGALADDDDTAINLDGVNNWVEFPNSSSLNSPSEAITMEAWAKPSTDISLFNVLTNPRVLIRKGDIGGGQQWQYGIDLAYDLTGPTDLVHVHLNIGGVRRSFEFRGAFRGSWQAAIWNHIVVTYNRQFVRLFVNGIEAIYGGQAQTGNLTPTTKALALGAYLGSGTGYRFPGGVDEVAIYPSALSAARIQAHHRAGLNGCDGIADIPGAVDSTYVPTPQDVLTQLRVRVTATNTSGSASASSAFTDRVFALYSYAEATALGIETPPTPAQWGLPVCVPNPNWSGYPTGEEAELAAAQAPEEPVCADDPTLSTTIGVGLIPPHGSTQGPGYHHNGAQLFQNSAAQGGRLAVEVSNPNVDRDADQEFVVARVLAKPVSGQDSWLEVGWTEHSSRDDRRYVYTLDRRPDTWVFHEQYRIADGRYVVFRVRDCRPNVCADILRDGKWIPIRKASDFLCMTENEDSICYIEEYLEIHSTDNLSHPDMNAPIDGEGVNFRDTRLRTAPFQWPLWEDIVFDTQGGKVDPYAVCWRSKWHKFRAGKGITCTSEETPQG